MREGEVEGQVPRILPKAHLPQVVRCTGLDKAFARARMRNLLRHLDIQHWNFRQTLTDLLAVHSAAAECPIEQGIRLVCGMRGMPNTLQHINVAEGT